MEPRPSIYPSEAWEAFISEYKTWYFLFTQSLWQKAFFTIGKIERDL